MRRLRIGMAQVNSTVGDFKGNTKKILGAIDRAKSLGVDLLTFPEPAICGYPPEDLLFKPRFIDENLRSLDQVINHSSGLTVVVGFVEAKEDIYNAAAVIHDGRLVSTTGNKSEMAAGYTTLYGDMAGGFAVIKDVPKTLIFKLARYRNSLAGTELIPNSIIDKVPSAELRPDQKDTDSLPPYEQLDPVLTAYVEEDKSIEQIIAMGFEEVTVKLAARLVDTSEYKRRQAPPGIKITPRAFGRDRRLPITNRFKG